MTREGYRASYRRIPLSRERTPEAEDLDALHAQVGVGLVCVRLFLCACLGGGGVRGFGMCVLVEGRGFVFDQVREY